MVSKKIIIFLYFSFIISACDDSGDISKLNSTILGSWKLDKSFVNEKESDNLKDIEITFFDNSNFQRRENEDLLFGNWNIKSNSKLEIKWEGGGKAEYKIEKLTSNNLQYSFYIDEGTGFPQLELTYSFIKSKSSG